MLILPAIPPMIKPQAYAKEDTNDKAGEARWKLFAFIIPMKKTDT